MERLQKILARSGLGSRREIERWIEEGRISVNGKIAKLGTSVSEKDKLLLDGKPVSAKRLQQAPSRVLIYNKPIGEICTRSDPQGRPTVFDRLPHLQEGRWIVVGRLDINTSGLLLFTTDGELANKLMHPSSQMDREYVVRVMGQVDDDALERLKSGVMLEDGEARFTDIARATNKKEDAINQWFYCCLVEGRNREVRRLWESQGFKVSRLKRVRFGPVNLLAKAKEGNWYELGPADLASLYQEAGLSYTPLQPTRRVDRHEVKRQARKAQKPARPRTRAAKK